MSRLTRWMDAALYPQFDSNWDDSLFREEILTRLRPEHSVLDLGAGAGIVSQMNFRGLAARLCGIDLDPRVRSNPFLDDAQVGDVEKLPYSGETFDIVIADNVVEHLARPEAVFREIARVLRPGGLFMFKTPNRNHYMPAIASLTPHWFHRAYNKLRGRAGADTFATCYRANTPEAVRKLASGAGFDRVSVRLIEGRPEYLRFFAPGYLAGWMYERLVNGVRPLEKFRILMMVTLQKPDRPA